VNFLINGDNENIALHFNPRFDTHVVVRNSLRNGVWENEERNLGFGFHWNRNETCEVSVWSIAKMFNYTISVRFCCGEL